jgi:hypothetical protein
LVVIAIIALLMALLLPAIQKVREAANKMLCASNLRQICIASHNYHNDFNKLPPGFLANSRAAAYPASLDGPLLGTLYFLLPYMEQDNVFKNFKLPASSVAAPPGPNQLWFDNPLAPYGSTNPATLSNYAWATTKIKAFLCPSASRFSAAYNSGFFTPTGGGQVIGMFSWQDGSNTFTGGYIDDGVGVEQWYPMGATNYLCSSGSGNPGFGFVANGPLMMFEGVFSDRSTLTLGQLTVQDGTSNTFAFGENAGSRGYWANPDLIDTLNIVWASSMNGCTTGGLWRAGRDSNGNVPDFRRFSSYHSAGVQFSFADGHTGTVRFGNTANLVGRPTAAGTTAATMYAWNSDWTVLMQLAGRRDGLNYDAGSLLD